MLVAARPLTARGSTDTGSFRFYILLLLAALGICATSQAEVLTNHPFPGVSWCSVTRENPPTRLFVAEIELTNSNVRLRVAPGGPDPDGPGPWQTTLMPPTQVAA